MIFEAIKDQHVPVRLLSRFIERKRVPNALLFWGASGVGKGLTAFTLAKALMCPADEPEVLSSLAARKIDHGNHPDLHVVSPVKKSRIIDVDAIDTIIELASLHPTEAGRRVFIIHEADRMRAPAQNHLLKTLEEPLGKSVFILLTEHPQLLLPTIRSRCQRVRFGGLRPETVKEILLREREISPERAEALASVSGGQMTRAFDLVDSDKRDVVLDVVRRLSEGEDPMEVALEFSAYVAAQKDQFETAVQSATDISGFSELSPEDREQIKDEQAALVDALRRSAIMQMLYLMEVWYRDVLVYSATGDAEFVLNKDQQALLESAGVSDPDAKLGAVEKARLYLERFLNEERVFRDLFFALAK